MGGEFAGAIAATLGTAIGAWLLDRWLGVRKRISNWWRSVKARKSATEAMVNSWPTAMEFIGDAKLREDQAAAREVRVTAEFAGLREHLERQDAKLETIMAQQWGSMKLDPQARFICDSTGRNTQVNAAYAKLLRVGEAQLYGWGYKNYIDPSFVERYMATVLQAFTEHRRFEGTVVMVRGDETRVLVHVRLEPYPEYPEDGPAAHWFGAVMAVEELTK